MEKLKLPHDTIEVSRTDSDSQQVIRLSTLGHPNSTLNAIKQRKNSITSRSFYADVNFDLQFEAGGRARERNSNFQIEVPMRRCYFFEALDFQTVFIFHSYNDDLSSFTLVLTI